MIIDLQRRIAEIGRIRIGQQTTSNGKTRPTKLDTFRLTSADKQSIEQAARLYGGQPREWEAPSGKQWECITETDSLHVIVPPSDMAFSQHYELWSGGGCQRRCDGANETISDGPCLCDPDNRECDIHTRLSVMLADLAGLGVWRIDTKGYYAAVELQGAVGVVQMAAGRGQMLPARLRLEQRMVKRPGEQTKRFAVPVLDVAITPAQLLQGGASFDPLDAGMVEIEGPPIPPAVDPKRAREYWDNNPDGNLQDAIEYGRGKSLTPVPESVLTAKQRQELNEKLQGGAPLTPVEFVGDTARALTPVPASVPERPTTSVKEQATATRERKPRKNAAQPIPSTGLKPRTAAQARAAVHPYHDEIEDQRLTLTDEPPPDDERQPIYKDDAPMEQAEYGEHQLQLEREIEPITERQSKKLLILLREAGFEDRDSRMAFCIAAINRNITSSNELTKTEASKLIDTLENNQPG